MYDLAIQFKQVHYNIEDKPILENLTGIFPKGKITTLIGPSGAGKTTLLKLCNGLLSANSGEIKVYHKPLTNYSPTALRREIGIALQNAPMIPGTVFQNLALPLKLQKKVLNEENAIEALQRVGLDQQLLHQQADELSGGQRQKVSIARTLMNGSNILLLDEITSALDRHSAQEIEQLITKIHQQYKTTIIWITHNLTQAERIGDYFWMLKEGKIIETGPIHQLFTSKNPNVQQFVKGDLL